MLAKRRQGVGQASSHQQARRIAADEAHDIADDVGPQAGAGRQHRRVVDAGFDIADPVPGRLGRVDLADRDEFIEDPMVEIDPHALALAMIGAGDEPLAGGVDFARLGPAAVEPFGKARAIGREIDPAMDEKIEPGKEIGEPRTLAGMASRQFVEEQ